MLTKIIGLMIVAAVMIPAGSFAVPVSEKRAADLAEAIDAGRRTGDPLGTLFVEALLGGSAPTDVPTALSAALTRLEKAVAKLAVNYQAETGDDIGLSPRLIAIGIPEATAEITDATELSIFQEQFTTRRNLREYRDDKRRAIAEANARATEQAEATQTAIAEAIPTPTEAR